MTEEDEREIPTAAEIKEDNSFPTPGTSIALRNLDWNILEAGDELVRREDAREAQEEARQNERQRILDLIDQHGRETENEEIQMELAELRGEIRGLSKQNVDGEED